MRKTLFIAMITLLVSLSYTNVAFSDDEQTDAKLIQAYSDIVKKSDFDRELFPADWFDAEKIDTELITLNWNIVRQDLEEASKRILDQEIKPSFELQFYSKPTNPESDEGSMSHLRMVRIMINGTEYSHINVFKKVFDRIVVFGVKNVFEQRQRVLFGMELKQEYLLPSGKPNMVKIHEKVLDTLQMDDFSEKIKLPEGMKLPRRFQVENHICEANRSEALTNWTPYNVVLPSGKVIRDQFFWRLILTVKLVSKGHGENKTDALETVLIADIGKKNLANMSINRVGKAGITGTRPETKIYLEQTSIAITYTVGRYIEGDFTNEPENAVRRMNYVRDGYIGDPDSIFIRIAAQTLDIFDNTLKRRFD